MNKQHPEHRVEHAPVRTGRVAPRGLIREVWGAHLRPIAVVTLAVFGWCVCEPWNYVLALQTQPAAGTTAAERAPERIDRTLRHLQRGIDVVERRVAQSEPELAADLAALAVLWQEIEAVDPEVRDDFRRIGDRLDAAGVPAEIRRRHEQAVADYEAGMRLLGAGLAAIRNLYDEIKSARDQGRSEAVTARSGELKAKVKQVAAFLREKVDAPRHTPLDPHLLPHRPSSLARREPRSQASDFAALAASSGPSPAAGTAKVLGLAASATLPEPADLAATIDAPRTPEILAKAASLGNHPLRIFEFVRNEIDFTPTHGSIQGAQGCLQTRRCNDMDTASLLIALLRAAGTPARYALGTIEVPIDKVKNWTGGFSDAPAALDFVASSGTPVTGLTSGGALVAARLEHVWVEAFLDYIPSRGAVSGDRDTWVPLDPSFKQFDYVEGIDLASATDVDEEALFRQLVNGASVDPDGAVTGIDLAAAEARAQEVKQDVESYLDSHAITTPTGIVGGKSIRPLTLSALPGSLPYHVLVRGSSFAAVPESLRHKLRFEVAASPALAGAPELVYQASLPELAARKITLSFAPATAADEATLKSFIPTAPDAGPEDFPSSLPAYLVKVKPELRVEGNVVASGGSSTLGQLGEFRLTFLEPGSGPRTVVNDLVAGTYNAIVLNLGRVESADARRAQAAAKIARIQSGNVDDLTKDDLVGELLYSAGLLYWAELDFFSAANSRLQQVVTSRLPSEGIFTYDLKVTLLFGTPRTVSTGAVFTDVDSDVQAVAAIDGTRSRTVNFLAVTGGLASRAESAVWDQLVNEQPTGQGITAVSYIEAAARQGIPIYQVDRNNLANVLPRLQVSPAIKADVQNAVAAGKVVTIPQREFAKDGFVGVGYIVFDLETGAGGYLISGGLAGGGFDLPNVPVWVNVLLGLLLVALGAIASAASLPALALFAAIAGLVLIAWDALATIQDVLNDPNLSQHAKDLLVGGLVMLALVGAAITIFGLFGGLALVALSVYWVIAAILFSGILLSLGRLFDRRLPLAAAARLRRRFLEELIGDSWIRGMSRAGA